MHATTQVYLTDIMGGKCFIQKSTQSITQLTWSSRTVRANVGGPWGSGNDDCLERAMSNFPGWWSYSKNRRCLYHSGVCICQHSWSGNLRSVQCTILCKFYLKRKKKEKKYWPLVSDMYTEVFSREVCWCLQLTLKSIKIDTRTNWWILLW